MLVCGVDFLGWGDDLLVCFVVWYFIFSLNLLIWVVYYGLVGFGGVSFVLTFGVCEL